MKKVLFTAKVVKLHINAFHLPFLQLFKEAGWETSVASYNDFENKDECNIPYCDVFYDLYFGRNPFSLKNIQTIKKLKSIIDENDYEIIHCHTPIAALLTRLAAIKARKKGTKVLYTAHGFHFYKGAPLINWLLFYPAEWLAAYFTDLLITINHEDFEFAKKHLHAKKVKYIPGVGVDLNKFGRCEIDVTKKDRNLVFRLMQHCCYQ